MSVDVDTRTRAESMHAVGGIALASAVAVAIILGIHPLSSTDAYSDGLVFVEHVSTFWIVIHLVGALATLAFPLAVASWGVTLSTPTARVWGRLAGSVATVGTGIGVLHLVATDTIVVAFFQDTVDEAGADAVVSADLLMRLHAATLTAWIIGFWLGVQLVIAVAAWLDGRRGWEFGLPALGASMLVVSIGITMAEGQYTAASDMVFFRIPVALFLVWLGLAGYAMRTRATRRAATPPS